MYHSDLIKFTEQTKKLTAMVIESEVVTNDFLTSTFANFFSTVVSAHNSTEVLQLANSSHKCNGHIKD